MSPAEPVDEEQRQACPAGRLPAVEDPLAIDLLERHPGVRSRYLMTEAAGVRLGRVFWERGWGRGRGGEREEELLTTRQQWQTQVCYAGGMGYHESQVGRSTTIQAGRERVAGRFCLFRDRQGLGLDSEALSGVPVLISLLRDHWPY